MWRELSRTEPLNNDFLVDMAASCEEMGCYALYFDLHRRLAQSHSSILVEKAPNSRTLWHGSTIPTASKLSRQEGVCYGFSPPIRCDPPVSAKIEGATDLGVNHNWLDWWRLTTKQPATISSTLRVRVPFGHDYLGG